MSTSEIEEFVNGALISWVSFDFIEINHKKSH